MKKLIVFILSIVLVLGVGVTSAFAKFPFPQVTICHTPSNPDQTMSVPLAALGGHLGHGDYLGACNEPGPEPSPTPSPSPSPSPEPCEDEEYILYVDGDECPEPTPTPEPTPEPTPVPLTQGNEGCSQDCQPSYHPPVCSGQYADKPAWVHVDRVNDTEVKIQWASNNADRFALLYGYVDEGTLPYGIPHLNGDSREVNIGQLRANEAINVQLFAYRGECSISSEIIDP